MKINSFNQSRIMLYVAVSLLIVHQGAIKPILATGGNIPSKENSICHVSEYQSNERRSCKLPFSIKDKLTGDVKTFKGCTTYRDHEKRFWCSTNVTKDGFHTWGSRMWGYCTENEACPKDHSVQETKVQYFMAETFGTDLTRTRLGIFPNLDTHYLLNSSCPCINYKRCDWSRELTKLIDPLPKSNLERRQAVKLMRSVICDKQKRALRCCDEKEIIDPCHNCPSPPIGTNTELGTWLPLSSKGQCGKSTGAGLIHDGTDAAPGAFPFAALLGYESPKYPGKLFYTCGGTVINKHYVLTAAHCTLTDLGPIKEVVLGEHKVGEDPECWKNNTYCRSVQRFGVESVINHPSWNAAGNGYRKGYDIALVRLNRKATFFSDDYQSPVLPVCLSIDEYEPGGEKNPINVTDRVTVTGWGRTTNNPTQFNANYNISGAAQDILQKVEIPIVSGKECRNEYGIFKKDTQLCAGEEKAGKDSCSGDSGGPMTYRHSVNDPWYLVGLVSYGATKCGDKPGVYTYVPHYIPWIRRMLKE